MATIINNGNSGLLARTKINTAITELNTATTNIATLTTTTATHTSQIATITTNVATNTSAISTLNTTVSGLVTSVNTHTGQISTLNTNVSALQTSVTTNTTNIATNTADILLRQLKDGINTLREDYSTANGNFAIANSSNTQFVNFTGAASGLSVPADATIPLVARGKRFSFWNNTASSGDVTITPAGGVTVEYAGSLNATVVTGVYCELIHTGTDRWLRVN